MVGGVGGDAEDRAVETRSDRERRIEGTIREQPCGAADGRTVERGERATEQDPPIGL